MARSFVRSSKYRHVFGKPDKKEHCFDNVRITNFPHDSNMCAVNAKFVAVVLEAQGGGAFGVFPIDKPRRFDIDHPRVCGHKARVLDISWNPFDENEIASCSEDCTVKTWRIPDGGIKEEMTDYVQDMARHQKKVGHIKWHPSAANVLASVGFDHLIVIWNTATGESLFDISGIHSDIIYSFSWSYNGSQFATTCKDKKIRVIDARSGDVISEGPSHVGTKPSQVVYCGSINKLFTTGFTRMSERQYALWNPDDLSKPLTMENIDTGTGVLFVYWDEGTNMVYIAGKGDTQIKYFEVTDSSPYVFFLSMYQSKESQRGLGVLPKKDVSYMQCEVMRFFKLHNKSPGMVEPIPMTVPRKSDMFQDDIYPPCASGEPALTAEEWASGTDKNPKLLKFTRDGLVPTDSKSDQPAKDGAKSGPEEPQTFQQYKEAYRKLKDENERLKKELEKYT